MRKHSKELTEKQRAAQTVRLRVWRHNAFSGNAVMIKRQLQAMLASDSITPAARLLAEEMEKFSDKLIVHVKERIDLC